MLAVLFEVIRKPLYFFPRFILYYFFLILLIYGGLGFGFWGWALILGFWVGSSGFFWVGALYINIKE